MRVWFPKVPYVRVFQKRTLRLHFDWQKMYLRFAKKWLNPNKNKKKKTTFEPNIKKLTYTELFRKLCSPTPNLPSTFETHKNVGDFFFIIYMSTYMHVLYIYQVKKWRIVLIPHPSHPIPSVSKTCSRFQKGKFPLINCKC